MRLAILSILVMGSVPGLSAGPLPAEIPLPSACLAVPAENPSVTLCSAVEVGDFGGFTETLKGLAIDIDAPPPHYPPPTLDEMDRAPLFAGITVDRPAIRGPEPPAAVLFLSGMACIEILRRRRRLARTIRRSRRRVYTVRSMA